MEKKFNRDIEILKRTNQNLEMKSSITKIKIQLKALLIEWNKLKIEY
jgi:hypothetical protein